jgi:transcriptional regulator with XRE-family HTH domain
VASSPTVWLRWLSHELLRLRKEAGLERAEVATAIRCTTQKIGHLETAHTPPKIKDLEEILLPMYKVPKERWPYYLQAARDARKKGWWENYTDAMPTWFSLYVGLEQGASELYSWDPLLLHGLLQTREYMTAVQRGGSPELPDAEVEQLVEVRLARQNILDAEEPPRLWLVTSEAALRSNIGGPQTMRAQLEHVLEMAKRPRITVQLLPLDAGAHPGLRGPVIIMGFPTEGDNGVVYLEYRTGAFYLEDAAQVKDYQISFEHLRSQALSPAASRKRIAAIAEELT